jgi:hypothetical protein
MRQIVDGATVVERIQFLSAAGVAQPIAGLECSAQWRSSVASSATPVITNADLYTWLVIANTAGLGGRAVSLRVTAYDPASTETVISDLEYMVRT